MIGLSGTSVAFNHIVITKVTDFNCQEFENDVAASRLRLSGHGGSKRASSVTQQDPFKPVNWDISIDRLSSTRVNRILRNRK